MGIAALNPSCGVIHDALEIQSPLPAGFVWTFRSDIWRRSVTACPTFANSARESVCSMGAEMRTQLEKLKLQANNHHIRRDNHHRNHHRNHYRSRRDSRSWLHCTNL